MAGRLVMAGLALVTLAGCGLLGGEPEAARPSGLELEDGTAEGAPPSAPGPSPSSSSSAPAASEPAPPPPVPTTSVAPGAITTTAWVDQVMIICAEEYAGLAAAEVPEDDPVALAAQVRRIEIAYTQWADRVEALPVPDRRTEANLIEGLRRLRASVDLLRPAVQLAAEGEVAEARQAVWSWTQAIAGASTALSVAGVPDACWT